VAQLESTQIRAGSSFPLGATLSPDGVNFSLFSKNSTLVELLLFNHVDDAKPARVISLDPWKNRTYHYWHVFVPGLKPGQIYGYRAQGPFELQRGLRFDREKILSIPTAGRWRCRSDTAASQPPSRETIARPQ